MYREDAVVLRQPVIADRSSVWRAISEPDGLARWQADVVEGCPAVGGRLRLAWPALGAEVALEVAERREQELIALRAGEWLVRMEIAPGGVVLSHSGLGRDSELRDGTRSGWALSLAILAHALEGHASEARSATWAVSPVRATAAHAHTFFSDPDALGAWLGQGTGVGAPGSTIELRLAHGEALTGRVLANEDGRDVAFSWSERGNSVLALRTLPLSDGMRLLALCWSRWGSIEAAPPVVGGLSAAVRRLSRLMSGAAEG